MKEKIKKKYRSLINKFKLEFAKDVYMGNEFHIVLRKKGIKIIIINEIGTLPRASIVFLNKEKKIRINKIGYKFHQKLWKIMDSSKGDFEKEYINFWKNNEADIKEFYMQMKSFPKIDKIMSGLYIQS